MCKLDAMYLTMSMFTIKAFQSDIYYFIFHCRVELLPYDLITQLFRILSVANDRGMNKRVLAVVGLYEFVTK